MARPLILEPDLPNKSRNLGPVNFCLQFDTGCLIFCHDSFRIANINIILF